MGYLQLHWIQLEVPFRFAQEDLREEEGISVVSWTVAKELVWQSCAGSPGVFNCFHVGIDTNGKNYINNRHNVTDRDTET